MSHSLSPCELAYIFQSHGIEPDEEFVAAAGRNSGYVAAWQLPDGKYVIAYGNNAKTEYSVVDTVGDLSRWLSGPE
jgi:hypothetical protein